MTGMFFKKVVLGQDGLSSEVLTIFCIHNSHLYFAAESNQVMWPKTVKKTQTYKNSMPKKKKKKEDSDTFYSHH